jgi:hypothetical protein
LQGQALPLRAVSGVLCVRAASAAADCARGCLPRPCRAPPPARALLPQLAEWLCAHYGSDARATRLVEKTHLFIMPTMNPDGFARRRRENG